MAVNTYAPTKPRPKKQTALQRLTAQKIELSFDERKAISFVPYLLFLTLLGIIYIGNTYYSDKAVRELNIIQSEVEELRIEYSSKKYESMFYSKKEEIEKKIRGRGLIERSGGMYVIELDKD